MLAVVPNPGASATTIENREVAVPDLDVGTSYPRLGYAVRISNLGRGVVLTRPLPNKTPSVGMKQIEMWRKYCSVTHYVWLAST